ncbi:hypothetical protein ACIKP9_00535 [Methylobacillus methanolivorans]|uniref:Lipoprotein n=1 Tax=Methylobacillus methanolivorans TaxID=1848927 RepID=A0ABW8GH54_9PROT
MKSTLSLLLLLASIIMSTPALARSTVPAINLDNIAITSASGASLKDSDVEQAIITAAGINQWSITKKEPGEIIAKLVVRNKHMIEVKILYSATQYSLLYSGSDNMKYELKDSTTYIHPFYNKWVAALRESIDRELLRR